jgi:hypothetical protein
MLLYLSNQSQVVQWCAQLATAAHWAETLLLDDPQKGFLQVRRQVAYLVKNKAPPWACSIRPRWLRSVPVKEPLTWPNSMLSTRVILPSFAGLGLWRQLWSNNP